MGSTDVDATRRPRPTPTQRLLGLHDHCARRPASRRALVAVLLALVAGYGTLALGHLAERNIFMLSFLAIAGAGLYGAFLGGMVATVVGALFAALCLMAPRGTLLVHAREDDLRLSALLLAGTLIAVLCQMLHHAIRQLLQREAALRDSEESYRTVFHSVAELLSVHDLDGHILDVNEALERTYGYARHELLGRPGDVLLDPERTDFAGLLAQLRRELPARPLRLELWGRRRDGSTFPEEATFTHGRYFGRDVIIAVARDASARKEAEAALARSEEQLRQALKMEAIGRLAGGVAHDFNNLLTAIKGNAELAVLELPQGSPAHGELQQISATADRAADLTRQLLAFSRKQVRQPRLLDLNALVQDTERMLRRVIGVQVQMVTRMAEAPACVLADAGQLEQVILNLVVNARDAMPQGGEIAVEVGSGIMPAAEGRPASDAVTLSVRDTGSGIPPHIREHIFEPFFTTKGQSKGTGLGLSTVYGIVRQSGGEIEVESEEGQGTCFRVSLPRAAGQLAAAEERVAAAPPTASGVILLVEDDPAVRSLTERMLRRGGYRVVAAADGPAALALVRDQRLLPDLLLTDVQMPEMNGPEVARRLLRQIPDLPVLFVSGYASASARADGALPPGSVLLEKPFTAQALLAHVAARIATRAAA